MTADILDDPHPHIRAADISAAFGKRANWFKRNRKQLLAEGFPHPISRGVWLREEVKAFRQRKGGVRRPIHQRTAP
jgi:hypothetical protein